MNELIEKEKIIIEDMIYEVRGVQVMLDSDIAKLYHVETKRINEAVKNNPDKFPERFSWVLTKEETKKIRSKISTLEIKGQGKYSKYDPRVFTEQGLYMLATILKSKVATEVSIAIMDTFVKMRHYINYNKNFLPHKFMLLEKRVDENTQRINELFDKFDPKEIVKDYLFFEGDFYDSYSLLLDLFNTAKEEIIIIDNYAGKELLDILKKINKKIIIISKNIDDVLKKKYEQQYNNVSFINNSSFHDRFIILDRNILYSCGASFKDLGKKCFAINEFIDKEYLIKILETIYS
ncbi:MAG: ORF6N domain-containing protein [Firmicutes bacterium]|nr:ORF6N domain-containing protein [Bacillota bacterium]